jgi:hypothetical protein
LLIIIHLLGLFELTDGTVLYARAKGNTNPEDDELIAWAMNGYVNIFIGQVSMKANQ